MLHHRSFHRCTVLNTATRLSRLGRCSVSSIPRIYHDTPLCKPTIMPTPQLQQRPIHLILDFDGTVTHSDTMHLLASAGYSRHSLLSSSQPLPSLPPLPPWSHFVSAYLDDFTAHERQYRPTATERTSVELEIAWLESLRGLEEDSYQRVVGAGVFEGVEVRDLRQTVDRKIAAGELRFRDGLDELIEAVTELNRAVRVEAWQYGHRDDCIASGCTDGEAKADADADTDTKVDVISVNWSTSFINQVLSSSLPSNSSSRIRVFANELPSLTDSKTSTSTPSFSFRVPPEEIRTASDKAAFLRYAVETRASLNTSLSTKTSDRTYKNNHFRNHNQNQSQKHRSDHTRIRPLVVYIGDSTTDLECLLAADVGICMRDAEAMDSSQRELAETCVRIGVEVEDFGRLDRSYEFGFGEEAETEMEKRKKVWWVDGFEMVRKGLVSAGLLR